MQWTLVPLLDRRAIRAFRRRTPVVLTVHDTTPYNGKAVSRAQTGGFDRVLAEVDRLIVHTNAGRDALAKRGIDRGRIAVVPHGLLAGRAHARAPRADGRWHIVQFGKIQDYKGVDVLIEALGQMPSAARSRIAVTVAGEALVDLLPLSARAAALGLAPPLFHLRPGRLSDAEVDALLASADAFVFPYRAIEASGVLFLVASLGRWIIASDLGAFSTMIGVDGQAGTLVSPGDPGALARAIAFSVGRTPTRNIAGAVPGWDEIGAMTRAVYEDALGTRAAV